MLAIIIEQMRIINVGYIRISIGVVVGVLQDLITNDL